MQHVLVKHGPWFVEKYGSLSVWSCQGMEKSHHAAKAATQSHSQHGGTEKHHSIIVQQYQWWYRCIQHRYTVRANQEFAEANAPPIDEQAIGRAKRRRETWHDSDARAASASWRSGREWDGRRWVINSSAVDGESSPGQCGTLHSGHNSVPHAEETSDTPNSATILNDGHFAEAGSGLESESQSSQYPDNHVTDIS